MPSYTFKITPINEELPYDVRDHLYDNPHLVAMTAPRPLFGIEVDLELPWTGQVLVDPTNAEHVRRNFELDATICRWTDPDSAIRIGRQEIVDEYGEEAADRLDDFDFRDTWYHTARQQTQTIEVP